MIRLTRPTLLALALMLAACTLRAQTAITFDDLAKRIDPFFAPELVQDIKDALPQAQIDIWGYDVGDYSGDNANDIVIVFHRRGEPGKRMISSLFVDIDGVLTLVKETQAEYLELPIEVGVGISDGRAICARKLAQGKWEIEGYRYRDGVVLLADKFTTEAQGNITYETYRNFQTLEAYDRYISTADTQVVFRNDFMAVPSYARGRDVGTGYQTTAAVVRSKYIQRGSYYWKDEKDLTLFTRSAWDEKYLYLNIIVRDDQVTPNGIAPGDTTADRMELWLDMYNLGDRMHVGRRTRDFRMKTDSNIYGFTINLGDFIDDAPKVRIASSNTFDPEQSAAARNMKAVALRTDTGYVVKLRLPFAMFGFTAPPFPEDGGATQFGMGIVVYDVDNAYRPIETTVVTTGQNFDRTKPATYGSIVLIPTDQYWGEADNIFAEDVQERLKEIGN